MSFRKELQELGFFRDAEKLFSNHTPYKLFMIIKQLSKKDDRVLDVKDKNGNTLLHYAARFSCANLAAHILDPENAVLFVENRKKQTPLEYAFSSSHGTVGLGFKLCNEKEFYRDFLIYLIRKKNLDFVATYFAAMNFDLTSDIFEGCTALHYAAYTGDPETIHFFAIRQNCDFGKKNGRRETPMDVFRSIAKRDCIPNNIVQAVEEIKNEQGALKESILCKRKRHSLLFDNGPKRVTRRSAARRTGRAMKRWDHEMPYESGVFGNPIFLA